MENLTDADRALTCVAILMVLTLITPIAIARADRLLAAWRTARAAAD
jgi:hypothetical protein